MAGGSFALRVSGSEPTEGDALVPPDSSSILGQGVGSPRGTGEPEIDFIRIVEAHYGVTGARWAVGLSSACLLSLALAQIVVGAQVMDGLIIYLAGESCAVEYGWGTLRGICTSSINLQPFGHRSCVSLGFLVCMILCVGLGSLDLKENLIPQLLSFGCFVVSVTCFLVQFVANEADPAHYVPLADVGPDPSVTLGVVIFNFAFVVAVPSLLAESMPGVDVKEAMCTAVGVMLVVYLAFGLTGGHAFHHSHADVLTSLLTSAAPAQTKLAAFGFALAIVPCIPIYTVLVKENLLQAGLTWRSAFLYSNIVPWMVAMVAYTSRAFGDIVDWSSLLVSGFVNFAIPLLVYAKVKGCDVVGVCRSAVRWEASPHPKRPAADHAEGSAWLAVVLLAVITGLIMATIAIKVEGLMG